MHKKKFGQPLKIKITPSFTFETNLQNEFDKIKPSSSSNTLIDTEQISKSKLIIYQLYIIIYQLIFISYQGDENGDDNVKLEKIVADPLKLNQTILLKSHRMPKSKYKKHDSNDLNSKFTSIFNPGAFIDLSTNILNSVYASDLLLNSPSNFNNIAIESVNEDEQKSIK